MLHTGLDCEGPEVAAAVVVAAWVAASALAVAAAAQGEEDRRDLREVAEHCWSYEQVDRRLLGWTAAVVIQTGVEEEGEEGAIAGVPASRGVVQEEGAAVPRSAGEDQAGVVVAAAAVAGSGAGEEEGS